MVQSVLEFFQPIAAAGDQITMAKTLLWTDSILSLFSFIWLITGSVYVYRIWDVTFRVCNNNVYMFAFITVTMAYTMIGMMMLVGCYMACCGKERKPRHPRQQAQTMPIHVNY